MSLTISQATRADAGRIAAVLRAAFAPVATRFGLTRANCPSHTSFATADAVAREMDQGIQSYLGELGETAVACVALRMQAGTGAKMKRLAVLPDRQGKGNGRQLVAYAESVARRNLFPAIEVGIIAEHTALLDWYKELGYVELRREVIPRLPFTVLTLIKDLA